jgi:hypothetical protein
LAAVIIQKDDENNEALVSLMRTNIQGVDMNYPAIEKHVYIVYKMIKHFKSYILKNHTKFILPHPASLLVANPIFFDYSQKLPTPLAVS